MFFFRLEKQTSKNVADTAFRILIQLFAKNFFEEVQDHALIGSKLSKQEVQSKRTLIFKM